MSATFEIDPEAGIVHVRFEGVLTSADIVRVREEIEAHPTFSPGMGVLSDLRGCRESTLTSRAMSQLARQPDAAGVGRRALVVDDELLYGLARAWRAWAESGGKTIEIFSDVESARSWIRDAPSAT